LIARLAEPTVQLGESFISFSSSETVVSTFLNGTPLLATSNQIILILGDFRGRRMNDESGKCRGPWTRKRKPGSMVTDARPLFPDQAVASRFCCPKR
jgi:hypothetical protein